MYDYEHDGAEIYRQSFATIRAEADLSRLPADVARVAVRMVHACGQVDLVDDVGWSRGVVERAREALDAGAPVLPAALLMAAMLAIFDFAWYTSLAVMVSRARQTFVRSRIGRWVERTTGAILIALGVRVAIEQR